MAIVTPEMEAHRLHAIKETHGIHDLQPLFDAAVASPDDILGCRACGLIVLAKDGRSRLPRYLMPWVDELIAAQFGMVLPQENLGWTRYQSSLATQ